MKKPKLELVGLKKEYDNGQVIAVDGIDLRIEAGETLALLGSSGCGKSTTLNMIVGLEDPTEGDIQVDGKSVVGIQPGKRDIGLVFQDYAVFTSMTVWQNLAFGLQVRGVRAEKIYDAVDEVAELLGMMDKLDTPARELGGSELQRVAIGRTLVTRPQILLLDEPLSNLEAAARLAMRRELRRLQKEIGLTIIYVTHDQVEALSLADRIAVMDSGKILQVEETTRICERPDHIFVANFLGSPPMNMIRGEFTEEKGDVLFGNGNLTIRVGHRSTAMPDIPSGLHTLGISPETITLAPIDNATMVARLETIEPRGSETVITLEVDKTQIKLVSRSRISLSEGSTVGISVDPDSFVFYDNETSRRVEPAF